MIQEDRFVGDRVFSLNRRYRLLHALYAAARWVTRLATGGRYGFPLSEFVLVGRRPAQAVEAGLRLAG